MTASIIIRRFDKNDAAAVRDLFVRINRPLAPPSMFGLENVAGADAMELRRMYAEPNLRRRVIARTMLASLKMNAGASA